jgi:hypothetical protein
MLVHLGMNPLIRAGDQREALPDLRMLPAVTPGPIRVLAEKADPAWDK